MFETNVCIVEHWDISKFIYPQTIESSERCFSFLSHRRDDATLSSKMYRVNHEWQTLFSIAIQSFPKHQKIPRRKFKTEHQRLINTLLRKIILKQNFPSITARQIIFKENRRPYEKKRGAESIEVKSSISIFDIASIICPVRMYHWRDSVMISSQINSCNSAQLSTSYVNNYYYALSVPGTWYIF